MKIALAQINSTVGDVDSNAARILDAYRRGATAGVHVVVCPELCVTGYPPLDLLRQKSFVQQSLATLEHLAAATNQTALLVGCVGENKTHPGRALTNSAALLHAGKILATRAKTRLSICDDFDENYYFEPATENLPMTIGGRSVGLTLGADISGDDDCRTARLGPPSPLAALTTAGAEIIFNLAASPWHVGRTRTRYESLRGLAQQWRRPVVFCNQVGGNDELIFDGGSLVCNAAGQLVVQARLFEEDLVVVDVDHAPPVAFHETADEESLYRALVLGLRDYFHKCGFQTAVLGLSGGIDSALVACLAVEALGPENVHGLALPSPFSSPGSLDDAHALARNLGIRCDVLPIQSVFAACQEQLQPIFGDRSEDLTEENLQARIRGTLLMALANKSNSLLLTTSNKSELAVGYCTLYGDMNGGLAVINDVPKTMVYRLARWINRTREIIPAASITKAPSAELRPHQTDQDSLPPYDVLDAILDARLLQGKAVSEIIAAGFDETTVRQVIRLIDLSEYKRRQAAPGLKVTTPALGPARRMPLAQRFRE